MKLHMCPACLVPAILAAAVSAAAQQMSFEDVVRNLRNPDPKLRIAAVRLLQEARYPEAVVPMAALVNDPINDIQLETIAAELSFFLVDPVPARRRVAFFLEKRAESLSMTAFDRGPLVAWPRPAPPELVGALLQAVDDDHKQVRLDAIYALGVVAKPPLGNEAADRLIKALDHYDPAIREGAARVIGRLNVASAGDTLIKAINDSNADVRYAAMRALGEIRDERAVQALTDQFNYYAKGEGAWSALDALARIGHGSSVPLFTSQIDARDPYLRRAAAEGLGRARAKGEAAALQAAASSDESAMVRAAAAFALIKHGEHYTARLADFLDSEDRILQVQAYLLELGPSVAPELMPRLQEPDETTRRAILEVLGAIGDRAAIDALAPFAQDRDRRIAAAATQAIERIKLRG